MTIKTTLNNEDKILNVSPEESLLHILRRERLYKVRCGCEEGHCGNCMILLNDKPVPSCVIPVGTVYDSNIVTLEYFSKNYPEYTDIMNGFRKVGMSMCGYCDAGKIFTAYSLMKRNKLDREQIDTAIKFLDCCCTDHDTLVNGILYAIAEKQKREEKVLNGKK